MERTSAAAAVAAGAPATGGDRPPPDPAPPPVPRRTRRAAIAFLLVTVATSLLGVEAWPLTGWGFYSRALSDRVEEFKVLTVDRRGREHGIPWDRLPVAYRATYRQLPELVAGPAAERERACRAWRQGVVGIGGEVAEVRIYWTETERHLDGRPSSQSRRLEARCAVGRRPGGTGASPTPEPA